MTSHLMHQRGIVPENHQDYIFKTCKRIYGHKKEYQQGKDSIEKSFTNTKKHPLFVWKVRGGIREGQPQCNTTNSLAIQKDTLQTMNCLWIFRESGCCFKVHFSHKNFPYTLAYCRKLPIIFRGQITQKKKKKKSFLIA